MLYSFLAIFPICCRARDIAQDIERRRQRVQSTLEKLSGMKTTVEGAFKEQMAIQEKFLAELKIRGEEKRKLIEEESMKIGGEFHVQSTD